MKKTITKLISVFLLLTLWMSSGCRDDYEEPPEVVSSDEYVDLRPRQTPIRWQGSRTTCIVFAGVAALEASYKRFGYGDLDLSEEFINFSRKSFYLHPIWQDHLDKGVTARETQLGSTGGGGGVGVVAELGKAYKLPLENVMPYVDVNNYYESNFPALVQAIDKGSDATQKDYSDFNLDPRILTSNILKAEKWYSVGSYKELADAKDTDEIEKILKAGNEVVWDFAGANPYESIDENNIWQACSDCSIIGHSMLIVGFDKRDPDPAKHHFIVKNSWGTDNLTGTDMDGFTTISYDYVENYGVGAAYILWPTAPEAWPEIPFVGRWKTNLDGWKGTLDIYHLPGMSDYTFEFNFLRNVIPEQYEDYRIGTYYDTDGNPFRVNGSVSGNKLEFYIDSDEPLVRWDVIRGTPHVFYMDDYDYMSGFYELENGEEYAGYAVKGSYLNGGPQTPRPFSAQSYYPSMWQLDCNGKKGVLTFTKQAGNNNEFLLLDGTFLKNGSTNAVAAQLKMYYNDPSKVYVQIIDFDGEPESFIGRHLSWEGGLITGHTPETVDIRPFSMTRIESN